MRAEGTKIYLAYFGTSQPEPLALARSDEELAAAAPAPRGGCCLGPATILFS